MIQILPCKQIGWLKPSAIRSKPAALGHRARSSRRGWKSQHRFSAGHARGFAGLEMCVYFMGCKNFSIKHVCSMKLLSHWLNNSYSMLFNPLVIVGAINANMKRIFLFVSFLALVSTMLHSFYILLLFSLIHIFMLWHFVHDNNTVISYIGEAATNTN